MATRSARSARMAENTPPESAPQRPPADPRARALPRIKKAGQGNLVPFLTLEETIAETVPIQVFGVLYDMVAPQDMSPLDRHQVDATWQRMVELQGKVDQLDNPIVVNGQPLPPQPITDDDKLELEAAINRMVRMIVPGLPGNVFHRLNWAQKEAVVEGFLAWKASRMEATRLAQELEEQTGVGLLTGRNSSPGSSTGTPPPTRSAGRKSPRTS